MIRWIDNCLLKCYICTAILVNHVHFTSLAYRLTRLIVSHMIDFTLLLTIKLTKAVCIIIVMITQHTELIQYSSIWWWRRALTLHLHKLLLFFPSSVSQACLNVLVCETSWMYKSSLCFASTLHSRFLYFDINKRILI